ncbi:MAG: isoprenylcysteine carboxylmethyltransferase family protein [Bacteroidales bacterium]|nr:isoprenylcysteine carboxylmethyltransferase family protein [Bacteroidales bacterium]
MKKKNIAIEILPRVLWIVMVVCLYLGQHFTNSPPILNDNTLFICLGVVLSIGGLFLWFYVAYYMRKSLFDKSLVTACLFKYVRHPMYVGIYIMLLGFGILFFSEIWFIIMLIFIPVWYFNCKIEEKQMIDLHKEKYIDYKKRTGMFLPKLKN